MSAFIPPRIRSFIEATVDAHWQQYSGVERFIAMQPLLR